MKSQASSQPPTLAQLSLEAKIRLRGQLAARAWHRAANPSQARPENWQRVWYAQGARGSGKTRLGAETFAELILAHPPGDWACVAPTFGDARDTMIEHRRSGLKKALGATCVQWNRSLGELKVANGSTVYIDGADDGALRIQGKELRGCWCDEIGLWKTTTTKKGEHKGGMQAWEESIEFAVREAPALILCTGTPKGKKGVVKRLMEEPPERVVFTFPSLRENERNLVAAVVAGWRKRYAGTRLGKQELEGLILADVEGALWTEALIEEHRWPEQGEYWPRTDNRTVVSIDPAGSVAGDETGIIVASCQVTPASEAEGRLTEDTLEAFILADRSGNYTSKGWAEAAVEAFEEFGADRIVAERNNGGEMVETILREVAPNVPVSTVWASKGKQTRAEPAAALYEQGRVHHVGVYEELEAEQATWVPGEESPNRMDALVWALYDLILEGTGGFVVPHDDPSEEPVGITSDLLDKVM